MRAIGFVAIGAALSVAPSAHAQTKLAAVTDIVCQPTDSTCLQLQHANKQLAQIIDQLAAKPARRSAITITFGGPSILPFFGDGQNAADALATKYCKGINYPFGRAINWANQSSIGGIICYD